MLWPLQCLFKFVTGPDVLQNILGWNSTSPGSASSSASKTVSGPAARLFVVAAEHDVLCTPSICRDVALRYRAAFRELRHTQLSGRSPSSGLNEDKVGISPSNDDEDGIRFRIVRGLGHHLQNHVEWKRGAVEIESWIQNL
jgi:hypothetical protein